jgi:peptidyl-prolyl cis-trans isomerase A (cyclophilin A)
MGETGRVLLLVFLGIITFCNLLTWSVLTQRVTSTSALAEKGKVKGIGFAVRPTEQMEVHSSLMNSGKASLKQDGGDHRQIDGHDPYSPARKDENAALGDANASPATSQKAGHEDGEEHHGKKPKQGHKGNHGKKPGHEKKKEKKGALNNHKGAKPEHKAEVQSLQHGNGAAEKQQQEQHEPQTSNDHSGSSADGKILNHEGGEGGGGQKDASGSRAHELESKKDAAIEGQLKPKVVLFTDYGNITLELEPQAAPKTVANFLKNARTGYLNRTNGACFYRYEKGFVLQGGCCAGNSGATVPLEYNLPNIKYSVAMARTSDPNSGGSEFFINLRDNSDSLGPRKKGGYAVFANVISGFETITELKKLPTKGGKGKLTTYLKRPKINYVEIL